MSLLAPPAPVPLPILLVGAFLLLAGVVAALCFRLRRVERAASRTVRRVRAVRARGEAYRRETAAALDVLARAAAVRAPPALSERSPAVEVVPAPPLPEDAPTKPSERRGPGG